MSEIYVINLTDTRLALNAGYVSIPPYGFIARDEDCKNEPDFKYARDREWLKFSTTKPKSAPAQEAITFVTNAGSSPGMTEEEMLEFKASQSGAKQDNGTKTEAIGKGGFETTGEPTVTKLGGEEATETEAVVEAEPKKASKTKKSAE